MFGCLTAESLVLVASILEVAAGGVVSLLAAIERVYCMLAGDEVSLTWADTSASCCGVGSGSVVRQSRRLSYRALDDRTGFTSATHPEGLPTRQPGLPRREATARTLTISAARPGHPTACMFRSENKPRWPQCHIFIEEDQGHRRALPRFGISDELDDAAVVLAQRGYRCG